MPTLYLRFVCLYLFIMMQSKGDAEPQRCKSCDRLRPYDAAESGNAIQEIECRDKD